MSERFEVTCPCCQGILLVDPAGRRVVSHKPPVSKVANFDLAAEVDKLHNSSAESDKRFSEALAGHRSHQQNLSRRFDDLFSKAKEAGDEGPPPPRDIDL